MDNIRDFLARVLPWPNDDEQGFINVHVMGTGSDQNKFWTGTPTRDVDEFIGVVQKYLKWPKPPDIYFCTSRQAKTRLVNGKVRAAKHVEDAIAEKSIWLDIDVGKPPKSDGTLAAYSDITSALVALKEFVVAVGIPSPTALVASGRGLHPYWISKKSLNVDEWRRFALGLKQAAINHGLLCDAGITGDAARVLRVPGTFNFKTQPPRPVKLLHIKPEDFDYETSLNVLPSLSGLAVTTVGAKRCEFFGEPAKAFSGLVVESLSEGIGREENCVNLLSVAENGCGWLREAFETGGKDFSQGLWNLSTLAATFAEDGHALAHKMAEGHNDYSYETTDKLWDRKQSERTDRGLGWPSCKAIQAEGCKHCASCPHLAAQKSPLHLAGIFQSVGGATQAVEVSEAVQENVFKLTDADLPEGFVVRNGLIHSVEERKPNKDGEGGGLHYKLLIRSDVFEPWAQADPAGINFRVSKDIGRYHDVLIEEENMYKAKIAAYLNKKEVLYNAKNSDNLSDFFMSWIDKLQRAARSVDANVFGWARDQETNDLIGFAYGGRMYKLNGTTVSSGAIDPGLRAIYQPRGKKELWFEGCKLITNLHRPGLEAIIATGFASPLLVFTGHYSAMLSVWGDPGSGKTTAARLALAMWCNPKLAKEGPTSTLRSVMNKTGRTKNIPVLWDEIGSPEAQEVVHKIAFINTLGSEGSRLHADMTLQKKGDWQNLAIICSNASFVDFVVKKNPSTAAGLYRVLEYKEVKLNRSKTGVIADIDATRLHGALDWNYGRLGEEYAAYMAKNWADIEKAVEVKSRWYEEKCSLTPGERFWGMLAAVISVGAQLGNEMGAEFHVAELEEFLYEKILANRKEVGSHAVEGGSFENTSDLLTAFLKDMTGKTLRTRAIGPKKGMKYNLECLTYPVLQNATDVHWDLDARMLMISKPKFNAWLRMPGNNASPRLTRDGLEQHFGMKEAKRSLGAGTRYVQSQEMVMFIPVPEGSPLEETMNALGETEKENG